MANLTIRVASEQADDLRRCLLRTYAAGAVAQQHAVADLRDGRRDAMDAVLGHHRELADHGAALDQIGWEPRPDEAPQELSAHPEVLSDAAHEALTTAVEAFVEECDGYWRGASTGEPAARELRRVSALFELFVRVQEGD